MGINEDERCPPWNEVNSRRTYSLDTGKLIVYENIIHEESLPSEVAGLITAGSPGERPLIRVLPGHAFRSMSGGQSYSIITFFYAGKAPDPYDIKGGRRVLTHMGTT